MSHLPDLNRPAFDEAAAWLRARDYAVVSPVDLSIEVAGSWEAAKASNASDYERFVARDLEAIAECDAMVLLPGWEESRGARREFDEAARLGLRFFLYDDPLSEGVDKLEDVSAETIERSFRLWSSMSFDSKPWVFEPTPYDGERFIPYSENPARHVFDTGGIKDNRGKARLDLVPTRPLLAIAEVLEFGAVKYRPHNWRRGLPWPDTYASLMRHLLAWNDGEDLDKETGLSHLAHAGCQLMFLLDYSITGVQEDTDNRFIPCRAEDCLRALHPTTDHQEGAA